MEQTFVEKMSRLEKIADEDDIFQDYVNSLEEMKDSYDRLLRLIPRKLRSKLEGYVGYQSMLHQRKLVLALQNMEFPDETKGNG